MPCSRWSLSTCSPHGLRNGLSSYIGGSACSSSSGCVHSLVLPLAPQELRQYLSNLADQCASENNAVDVPLVIILDNLHHVGSLGEVFNGLLNCKDHKW